jgi:glycine cleavage system regulatory protein
MTIYLVLTVLGEDRPGLVESLSQVIAAHAGNWLESRMARLAGKFAGILRASVPDAHAAALTQALQALEREGLKITIEQSSVDEAAQIYQWLTLALMGYDRPGIIRDISHALASRRINIDELHTEYTSAPMSGEMLFKARAQLRVPQAVVISELQNHLEQLAHGLMVDITLEAAEGSHETGKE